MAQTGYTPIRLYYSTTAASTPSSSNLITGELAFNVADGKLYYKDLSNVVRLLVSAGTGGGTVTSVSGAGGTTGLTLTGGPITSTGTLTLGGTLNVANGGTGQSSYTDGQLLIGNTATGLLSKATLTAGTNVTITNGNGTITIASSGGGGGTGITAVAASYPIAVTGATGPTATITLVNVAGTVTGSTGTGAMVCNISPTLVTPILGTPTSGTLTNATGLPLTSGVTGVLPVANGGTGVTASTGSGPNVVLGAGPTISNANLTGHPTIEGVTSIGSTGAGYLVFNQAPSLTSPFLGTPQAGNLNLCTGYLYSNLSGTVPTWNQNTTGTAGGLSGTPSISVSGVSAIGLITTSNIVTCTNTGGYSALQSNNIAIGTNTNTISSTGSGNIFYFNVGGSFGSVYFAPGGNYQASNSPNWSTTSDINIKTNLHSITSALDKLNALKPIHFEYKDRLGQTQTGFIAQEFETVFPGHTLETEIEEKYKQYVPEGQTTLKALDLNLTAYLVKAIQELNAKVDAQAAEITALKAAK